MARPSKNTDDKIEQIAAKFAQLNGAPKGELPRPDNCITVAEYAAYAKIHEGTAWKWLNTIHKQGLAKRHKWGKCWCYEINESAEK